MSSFSIVCLLLDSSSPFGQVSLGIAAVATLAFQWRVSQKLIKSLGDPELRSSDRIGVGLMTIGAITFGAAVQLACLTILVTNQPIGSWPQLSRAGVSILSYVGLASVVVGIVFNVKGAFR